MTLKKTRQLSLPILLIFITGSVGLADSSDFTFRQGDRVVFVGNTFADQLRLHGYLETLLAIRRPEHNLRFRILGWSGDTLSVRPRPLNFGDLDEHLRQQKANVIVACFGMNESYDGPDAIEAFQADWRAFIDHARSQRYDGRSPPRLVMVSPIYHESTPHTGDAEAHNAVLKQFVDAMAEVALETATPFVDLYSTTRSLINESSSQRLTKNGIHLNQYGYWAVADLFASALNINDEPWRIEINARKQTVTNAEGTTVSPIQSTNGELAFTVTDKFLPNPVPPPGAVVHASLAVRQPTLIVQNLKPGSYRLLVNGEVVATAGHDQWAAGITLTNTPSNEAVEQLRTAIVEKNRNFFYRWRPANAEYVFGRRAKPFGVISFPPELELFDDMLDTADRDIWSRSKPLADQNWRIEPVEK